MATILLVEDEPDLALYEMKVLEEHGHAVFRCTGGAASSTACPMLKYGSCRLPDAAELILFACRTFAPLQGRRYTGRDLLRAYRRHPRYGALPMLVVSAQPGEALPGAGSLEYIDKYTPPADVVAAVERLLAS